jgi:spore coat polysaccharide biosynthesis protein SpsF
VVFIVTAPAISLLNSTILGQLSLAGQASLPLTIMPKILAIIQARMSSSRLPGKVLLDISGQPMLARVISRTRKARTLDGIVVATTIEPADDPVERMCAERGYTCYRGSPQDVLDRYYQAARIYGADVIVRITGDCPVIDPEIIDATVKIFFTEAESGFAATRLPPPWRRTLPIGLDVEVVSFASLERAWKEADQPFHREHVMPFFYEGTPPDLQALGRTPPSRPASRGEKGDDAAKLRSGDERGNLPSPTWYVTHGTSLRGFKVAVLNHDPDYGDLRWTVDTPDDLTLLRQIFAHFPGCETFSWQDILALFEREPDLGRINSAVRHKDFRESEGQNR